MGIIGDLFNSLFGGLFSNGWAFLNALGSLIGILAIVGGILILAIERLAGLKVKSSPISFIVVGTILICLCGLSTGLNYFGLLQF